MSTEIVKSYREAARVAKVKNVLAQVSFRAEGPECGPCSVRIGVSRVIVSGVPTRAMATTISNHLNNAIAESVAALWKIERDTILAAQGKDSEPEPTGAITE